MIWVLMASVAVCALTTLLTIASSPRLGAWLADNDLDGPQKMHASPVPRIGGVGMATGLVAGAIAMYWLDAGHSRELNALLVAAIPTFAAGTVEDVTKSVSPRGRLVAAAVSALLAVWLLGTTAEPAGWATFAQVLAWTGLGVPLAVFVVVGLANSVNIIDGMNGLSSMCVAMMAAGVAYIAFQVGDQFVLGIALSMVGACLGFFVWNYPRGLIFLGDGGAYLLGFLLAELCLLLTNHDSRVSPLAPLLIVAYPVFETAFTMYRRKVLRGLPVSAPDGSHLHTLIFRRLTRKIVGHGGPRALTRGNSMASPYLWALNCLTVVPAVIWWDDTAILFGWIVFFMTIYVYVYWRIVKFRTPAWMGAKRCRRDA
jgi:UDP-N-acetylmuramyl pentapeptide phosphotransferase/UDP-N-acetylglucosamine-1-phosphate transferase